MKINVITVGKFKEKFWQQAQEEYLKRLSRFADVAVIEVSEAPPSKSVEEQRAFESAELMKKAKGFVVALDKEGKTFSSEELAKFIDTKCTSGVSEFSFLVGGSNGFDEVLKRSADVTCSFSTLTFPHQLFRIMLLEQLYRAETILNHVSYHK